MKSGDEPSVRLYNRVNGMFQRIKASISRLPRQFWDDAFLILSIFLIALASFGLGRLSVIYGSREALKIEYAEGQGAAAVSAIAETAAAERNYVASINGTKYYLPNCSGVGRINDENKIWFTTKEEAEIAGYTPAANCSGL